MTEKILRLAVFLIAVILLFPGRARSEFNPETTVFIEAESMAVETSSPAENREPSLSTGEETSSDQREDQRPVESPAENREPSLSAGWVVDSQFNDQIGSTVLLSHGLGEPVADAAGRYLFPKSGEYRVFVRTRNWVASWTPNEAPGRFQVAVEGKKLDTIFGVEGNDWHWQYGGTVTIEAGEREVALCDLTGFDGRCDAILFTLDEQFTPPNDKSELAAFRRAALGLPAEAPDARSEPYDLVVVGGGVAGLCASVSAARLGLDVALIQNRFLLGGNNSSDVRVHLQGLINLDPFPNLGNLVYEFQHRHEGNAEKGENYEDQKKLDLARAESRLALFLGTHVFAVEKEGDQITAVLGRDILTGKELRFRGKLFADCTGDGNLGFMAGADWRMGRESKAETGESCAPDEADDMTMGASVQWYAVETPNETSFPILPWAITFSPESIRPMTHGDWDWETGLNWNQIDEFEKIRDHGLRAAYGHWSYMKNFMEGTWAEKVKNMKLGWVAYNAGKRESRRLLGDVILKEQDITSGTVWPDGTVTTTWAIDLHYPEAENSKYFPGEEFRTICKNLSSPPYAIPYRCFYSRNIRNMFMAGRDISVTHSALGTVRVMRTGGMMGEVVGMAASVCRQHDALPRDVYERYWPELVALMEKGIAPPPPGTSTLAKPAWAEELTNVAPQAAVSASSEHESGLYPAKNLNDGQINPPHNEGRYVSAKGNQHWVEFDFPEAASLCGLRFVSGDIPKYMRNNYVLQYEREGEWHDIPETLIKNRHGLDYALRFPTVTAKKFRLAFEIYYGQDLFRLWEVELYSEGN